MLLHPLRKLSAPRLLQILAQKRAETSSYLLLDSLLIDYVPYEEIPLTITSENLIAPSPPPSLDGESVLVKQDSLASDTSAEIFRFVVPLINTGIKSPLRRGIISFYEVA